jgi:unsaturated chondroitin disaccharide hydrolase
MASFLTFFFEPTTGAPRFGKTHQGYADDSCWARGQAWGIYGFALNYSYTGDLRLLRAAERVADYYLAHLPADHVAYWDLVFGDGSGEERDSSAAAIAACGLFELAHILPAGEARQRYHAVATAILNALIEGYTSRETPGSNALLLHGVYSKPRRDGVDEGSLWGDYFYLEALMRASRPGWRCYW